MEEKKINIFKFDSKLTQFEIAWISKFLTFPEITVFISLSKKLYSVKSIIRGDKYANLDRLKGLKVSKLINTLRTALRAQLIEDNEL